MQTLSRAKTEAAPSPAVTERTAVCAMPFLPTLEETQDIVSRAGLGITFYNPCPSPGQPWLWLEVEQHIFKLHQQMDGRALADCARACKRAADETAGQYIFVRGFPKFRVVEVR